MTEPTAPPSFTPVEVPPVKRGPGRPRKEGTDTAPTRPRGRPRGSASRSIEREVGAFLVLCNTPVAMFLPGDALDETEIIALAKATDDQCKRSPVFRSYVMQLLKLQSATSILAVVGMIGVRRAIRHNLVPLPPGLDGANIDASIGMAMAMMQGTPMPTLTVVPTETPVT